MIRIGALDGEEPTRDNEFVMKVSKTKSLDVRIDNYPKPVPLVNSTVSKL